MSGRRPGGGTSQISTSIIRQEPRGTSERVEVMEKRVYDAAVKNDDTTLRRLLDEDPLILDKASLNCQDKNPLHIAAMLGHVKFVKAILHVNTDMCLAVDRFGRIPLHLAAIKGRLDVLEDLILARPLAAREKTDGGGNVLHLCVKYNQLEALKILVQTIKDDDFVKWKNDDGMTILHLAIRDKQNETIMYLLENNLVDVNAKNAEGRTALDMYLLENNLVDVNAKNAKGRTALDLFHVDSEIARSLESAGAKRSKEIDSKNGGEWLSKKRDALMVVASLIATMAFQAGVSPPGGVWQDDNLDVSNAHVAGEAVMAYKHPRYYRNFVRANTVAFVSSLSTILFLISGLPFKRKFFMWALMVVMWLTASAVAVTYGISSVVITPHDKRKSLSHVIETAVTVWCGVMGLLLLGNTIRLITRWLERRGTDVLKRLRKHGNSNVQVQSNDKLGTPDMC